MRTLTRRGSYSRLLLALCIALLGQPLLAHVMGRARWVGLGFFMLVLVAALDATHADRRMRRLIWTLGLSAIATAWISFGYREANPEASGLVAGFFGMLDHTVSVVFLLLVIGLLIERVLAPGKITAERIVAAICAYLLIGMTWSELYQTVSVFAGPVLSSGAETTYSEYIYFSFVTLTTLGYGDILPTHPLARALAFLEAVVGVLYVAILVARLVALNIVHARADLYDEGDSADGSDDS